MMSALFCRYSADEPDPYMRTLMSADMAYTRAKKPKNQAAVIDSGERDMA